MGFYKSTTCTCRSTVFKGYWGKLLQKKEEKLKKRIGISSTVLKLKFKSKFHASVYDCVLQDHIKAGGFLNISLKIVSPTPPIVMLLSF